MVDFYTRFRKNMASIEITNDNDFELDEYFVEFVDINTNNIEYSTILKNNCWAKIENIENKNITIKVHRDGDIVYERNQHDIFNKVYIKIGSLSLGDTIGWIPYVEEYRKMHNVDVILYTAHNYLFDKVYDKIEFTNNFNADSFKNVDKKFKIDYGPELYLINGEKNIEKWYEENSEYDNCVDYFDYREYSLQSIAALILGLPLVEIKPLVNEYDDNRKIKGKYVVVAIQSTSQLKYWNNPFGWERVFDFLGKNGYKVVIIDKHKVFGIVNHFNRAPKSKYVIDKTGNYPLSDRITDIKYADMVITISSGLAWLSWAIGTPVIMISGFTKPFYEFQSNVIRLHNYSVCNGCWNDKNVTFDSSNWLFCPKENDFVCSKVIQPKDVTDAIKKFMK